MQVWYGIPVIVLVLAEWLIATETAQFVPNISIEHLDFLVHWHLGGIRYGYKRVRYSTGK